MPKIGALWEKTTKDNDGNEKIYHSGKVEIDGYFYYLDLYPTERTKDTSPSYQAYLKPARNYG